MKRISLESHWFPRLLQLSVNMCVCVCVCVCMCVCVHRYAYLYIYLCVCVPVHSAVGAQRVLCDRAGVPQGAGIWHIVSVGNSNRLRLSTCFDPFARFHFLRPFFFGVGVRGWRGGGLRGEASGRREEPSSRPSA